MSTSRSESNRETADAPESQGGELPAWLMALQSTDDEASPLAPPTTAGEAAPNWASPQPDAAGTMTEAPPAWLAGPSPSAPDAAAVAGPAQAVASPEPRPGSLLGEEDLPDWLKALADPPSDRPAAAPPVARVATRPTVPSWVTIAPESGPAAPSDPATGPEEAPPVWTARTNRPQPEVTTGAALFASLAEAAVSGTPVEDPAPPPPAPSTFQWWYLLIPALVVLAIVVAVVLKMMIP